MEHFQRLVVKTRYETIAVPRVGLAFGRSCTGPDWYPSVRAATGFDRSAPCPHTLAITQTRPGSGRPRA